MAERAVEVTLDLAGREVVVGTLWPHDKSSTFRYAADYLANPLAYALDPALPLSSSTTHTPPGKVLPNAFSDAAPDRWGQNLARRAERERAAAVDTTPRTLSAVDFLLAVNDVLRQGALRFRRPGTFEYFTPGVTGVPREVSLASLLRTTDQLVGHEYSSPSDLRDLIAAGSSLGGARPKAAVVNSGGVLTIAKFPRRGSDDWDVIGWEAATLDLARGAGITVPRSRLILVGGRRVLLVERFDRTGDRRLGYASALTLLEASDGDRRSYLEIAEALAQFGSASSVDNSQLFRRVIFSILVSNTDDHLRNHGFLRAVNGWRLSPAFDLNPDPETPGTLSTAIDFSDNSADIALALDNAEYFGLDAPTARAVVTEVEQATRDWRQAAAQLGLAAGEINLMAAAFDTPQRTLARRIGR